MERQYFAVRARGVPSRTLEQLADEIRNRQLGEHVPMILIEKGIRQRHRSQEFYLVFAVNTEDGSWPDDLLRLVSSTFGKFRAEPVAREDVKRFAVAGIDAIDNVVLIPFSAPKVASIEPPWASVTPDAQHTEAGSGTTQKVKAFENLLYWASHAASGSITTLAIAAGAMGLCTSTAGVRPMLRRLGLLGHIELSSDGSRWSICPPAIAKLPLDGDNPSYGLYGQRSASLLRGLQTIAAKVDGIAQPGSDGPPAWRCQFSSEEDADRAATEIGRHITHGVSAKQLSKILPSLDQWKQTLKVAHGVVPPLYEMRRWQGDQFVPVYGHSESGLYELTRRDSTEGRTLNMYFDAPTNRWLSGDWYGLRFLGNVSQRVPLRAAFVGGKLAIPLEQRWPFIYEKALVLLSGLLPAPMGENWLVYQDVPLRVAENLCEKLGVTIQK